MIRPAKGEYLLGRAAAARALAVEMRHRDTKAQTIVLAELYERAAEHNASQSELPGIPTILRANRSRSGPARSRKRGEAVRLKG